MSENKIVIAGAGGYLASNAILSLKKLENSRLYALSSRDGLRLVESENVKYIKADMNDYGRAKDIIADGCDVAMNFSWIGARGKDQDNDTVQEANEENSIKLLRSLIETGCSRFIQIGSMAEYGFVDGVITEYTECNPITAYAKRKLSCANRMREMCDASGVDFYEFRMGSIYGNRMDRENILGYLCGELSQGRFVKLKTSCLQDWEYTHVDDFSELLLTALQTSVPSGIYNITNGQTHELRYFIHILEEKYGLSNHIEFGDIDQGMGCQNIRCDISKIRDVFGKTSFISFEEGIESVINAVG